MYNFAAINPKCQLRYFVIVPRINKDGTNIDESKLGQANNANRYSKELLCFFLCSMNRNITYIFPVLPNVRISKICIRLKTSVASKPSSL